MFEIVRSQSIARPWEEVQAQFGDVAYHERNGHHRGVTFRVLEDGPESCDYEQETRIGPLRLRQGFRLLRKDPAHQVNQLVSGAFAPGSITFDLVADGPDTTTVTATLRSTGGGLTRLAGPLLRPGLGPALARGLREDRDDLESGTYFAGRSPRETH